MASDLSFVDFVCAQIQELGNVRYRKMFGDYSATASVNIAGDAFGGWSGMASCFFG